jgi:hypothetical protein
MPTAFEIIIHETAEKCNGGTKTIYLPEMIVGKARILYNERMREFTHEGRETQKISRRKPI